MELIILVLVFALLGYLLGGSRLGKKVDNATERLTLTTGKVADGTLRVNLPQLRPRFARTSLGGPPPSTRPAYGGLARDDAPPLPRSPSPLLPLFLLPLDIRKFRIPPT